MALRTDVSALYIDPRGPYPNLLADCWDEARDARNYAGPNPVVAHPPCGPWGTLRTLSAETTRQLALDAIGAVDRWGGVLEHPITSLIWRVVRPTLVVNQCDWGHPARKRTGLYIVGPVRIPYVPEPRKPTHWCSGGGTGRGKTPPGIKVCSAQQRRRTPIAFAEWLISLAAQAKKGREGCSAEEPASPRPWIGAEGAGSPEEPPFPPDSLGAWVTGACREALAALHGGRVP